MRTRLIILFLLSHLLAACAVAPRVSNSWRAAEYNGPAVRTLMVVGVGVDGASRRSFEDALAQRLQAQGVQVLTSYSQGVDAAAERSILINAAQKAGADGLIETRVLRAAYSTPANEGPVIMPGFGFGTHGGFAGASVIFGSSGSREVGATVESSLFAVPGARMLWSLTTEDYVPSDPKRSNEGLSKVIIEQLRAQGLI